MELCQQLTEAANHPCRIIQQLEHKLASLRKHHDPIKHFEDYENELHALFVQAERGVCDLNNVKKNDYTSMVV